MVVKIIVRHKLTNEEPKEYPLTFSKDTIITIGRQESNEVPLISQEVSRKHAEILMQDKDFYLIDLQSANGTILNDKKLKPKEKNLLRDGDVIKIDKFELIFKVEDFVFTEEDNQGTKTIAKEMLKELMKVFGVEGEHPMIRVIDGENEGKKFIFTNDITKIIIGRDDECDMVLSDTTVSRKHSEIVQNWTGEIAISDLNSTNGTFVNDNKINTNYRLNDGDRITIGTNQLIFIDPRRRSLYHFNIPTPIPMMGKNEIKIKEEKVEEQEEKIPPTDPSEIKSLGIGKFEIIALTICGIVIIVAIVFIVLLFS